jgi:alanine racemase
MKDDYREERNMSLSEASQHYRSTRARIDLEAFAGNVRAIRRHTGVRMMAAIKADAYGHGALACAEVLQREGVEFAGVAISEEALALREAGVMLPLLVFGRVPPRAMPALFRRRVACSLTCLRDIVEAQSAAAAADVTARVHLKVDTGMSRLGILPEESGQAIDLLRASPNLKLEGMYTHLADADADAVGSRSFTREQVHRFRQVGAWFADSGQKPDLLHCCASAGIFSVPDGYCDMVRPGIALYGGAHAPGQAFVTDPVMQVSARLSHIRILPAGCSVSYGRTWSSPTPRRIAVVPIGYADGVPRLLSNKGRFLVHGQSASIVGRVCMDMTMVDVTDIAGAGEGSEAVLFGNPALHGRQCPTADELAALTDTIAYEIFCGIGKRVPRLYGAAEL